MVDRASAPTCLVNETLFDEQLKDRPEVGGGATNLALRRLAAQRVVFLQRGGQFVVEIVEITRRRPAWSW